MPEKNAADPNEPTERERQTDRHRQTESETEREGEQSMIPGLRSDHPIPALNQINQGLLPGLITAVEMADSEVIIQCLGSP